MPTVIVLPLFPVISLDETIRSLASCCLSEKKNQIPMKSCSRSCLKKSIKVNNVNLITIKKKVQFTETIP